MNLENNYRYTENNNSVKKGVLFDKLQVCHAHEFWIIQENEAENVFMILGELFLAFQINFHHHKYFHDLKVSLLKIELMDDKCAINLSFSVHDNIAWQIKWQIMSEWQIRWRFVCIN